MNMKKLVTVITILTLSIFLVSCGGGTSSGTSNQLQIIYDSSGNCKAAWSGYRPIDIYVDFKYWGRLESGQSITGSVSSGSRLIQAAPFTSGCKKNVSGATVQTFNCSPDIVDVSKYYPGVYTMGADHHCW